MAEDLKTKRWIANRQFTRSEKRLKDALENAESIPISTIVRRYEELKTKWIVSKEAHDIYVTSLAQTFVEIAHIEAEGKWINELTVRLVNVFEMAGDLFIDQLKQKQLQVKPRSNDGGDVGCSDICNDGAGGVKQQARSVVGGGDASRTDICNDGAGGVKQQARGDVSGGDASRADICNDGAGGVKQRARGEVSGGDASRADICNDGACSVKQRTRGEASGGDVSRAVIYNDGADGVKQRARG